MRERTAFMTGHRIIAKKDMELLSVSLDYELRRLISKGVIFFGNGGAVGFDAYSAIKIIDLKLEYPEIKLIMALPCRNQHQKWNKEQKNTYAYILSKADKITYTSETYYKGCELARNRHLVNNSQYCIAYLRHDFGGTAYTVAYSKKQGLDVIMI